MYYDISIYTLTFDLINSFQIDFSRESTSEYEHSDVESDDGQQKKVKFPKKPDNLIPEDDKGIFFVV